MRGAFFLCFMMLLLSGCNFGKMSSLQKNMQNTPLGRLTQAFTRNVEGLQELRTHLTMLVGKLQEVAIKRISSFTSARSGAEDAARRFDQWMNSVSTRLLNVALKTAENMVSDSKGDIALSMRIQNAAYYAYVNLNMSGYFGGQPYDWFFENCLMGPLWVEFLNYRALGIIALVQVFQQFLDKMVITDKKLAEYISTVKSLNASCPTS